MKREAVIAGLASEGQALLLGSAEAGSSAVEAKKNFSAFNIMMVGPGRDLERESRENITVERF